MTMHEPNHADDAAKIEHRLESAAERARFADRPPPPAAFIRAVNRRSTARRLSRAAMIGTCIAIGLAIAAWPTGSRRESSGGTRALARNGADTPPAPPLFDPASPSIFAVNMSLRTRGIERTLEDLRPTRAASSQHVERIRPREDFGARAGASVGSRSWEVNDDPL